MIRFGNVSSQPHTMDDFYSHENPNVDSETPVQSQSTQHNHNPFIKQPHNLPSDHLQTPNHLKDNKIPGMSIIFGKQPGKRQVTSVTLNDSGSIKKGTIKLSQPRSNNQSSNIIPQSTPNTTTQSSLSSRISQLSNTSFLDQSNSYLEVPGIVADGQGGVLSIASLPDDQKAKITRLVDRLVTLATEHESLSAELLNTRTKHATEVESLLARYHAATDENNRLQRVISQEKESSEYKERVYLNYISQYQVAIQDLHSSSSQLASQAASSAAATISAATTESINKLLTQQRDISQLEALCQSQRVTLETYELTRLRTQQAHEVSIASIKSECEAMQQEVLILRAKLDECTSKYQASQSSSQEAYNKIAKESESKDKQIQELQHTIATLQDNLIQQKKNHDEYVNSQQLKELDQSLTLQNDTSLSLSQPSILSKENRQNLPVNTKKSQANSSSSKRSAVSTQLHRSIDSNESLRSNHSSGKPNESILTQPATVKKPTSATAYTSKHHTNHGTLSFKFDPQYDSSLFSLLDAIEQDR